MVLTAQEAGLVEAVAFTLHLLSKVDGLLAHPTLLPSSPVWHPAGESTVRNRGRALQGWDEAAGAGTEAPAAFPHPRVQRAPRVFAGCTDCRAGKEQNQSSGTQQCQLPPRDHWSCLPGAAEIPILEPWDLPAPVSARKRRKQYNAGRWCSQSYPGTSPGHSPPVTPCHGQGDCD